jgi:hypothetical protein
MVERLVMEDASVFSRELECQQRRASRKLLKYPEEPESGSQNTASGKKEAVSNGTHYSPSDPDARLTTKPGKPAAPVLPQPDERRYGQPFHHLHTGFQGEPRGQG